MNTIDRARYVLAFDTANEVIAVGVGQLHADTRTIEVVAHEEVEARRASNTQLLPCIDELCKRKGIVRQDIACVCVGRGPGSFTGVRIAMATAKGVASALEVALIGVSSLDAIAWGVWNAGGRGQLLVVADAMRKEVYPVEYELGDSGAQRLSRDRVVKAALAADEFILDVPARAARLVAGDALKKYAEEFAQTGIFAGEEAWTPTGQGLLLALQALWQAGECDPFDAQRHDPALVLPVYTRLSDAEENERVRLAANDAPDKPARDSKHVTMNDTARNNARGGLDGLAFKPLDAAHVDAVAAMEADIMGSDAWSASLVKDELGRSDRVWWAAYAADPLMPLAPDAPLVGYAGGWVVDGDVQILKIGTDPAWRRHGVARTLLARVASDARNLGAQTSSLEVRLSNEGAQRFYEQAGYAVLGERPRYYSDGEDALIMQAAELPCSESDVAGMAFQHYAGQEGDAGQRSSMNAQDKGAVLFDHRPLIFAIETSCDETAAAIADAREQLLSDVVASQVDFHARFGGVVPEIASRKHIEAICGVCDECLDRAALTLGMEAGALKLRDMNAIAVTYAPGLVGALVVGVAFAKGAAWAADIPFIVVNHLEGHLYANKIGDSAFRPPAVVSLVSGGNTMLVYMRSWGTYEILGTTIDDAVGEAFDKVAKALGLGYPGGPVISRFAAQGDPDAVPFPRAMMRSGDLCFSLSGLKTAVVTYINAERSAGRELNVPDICASFQQAVVDVQISKAKQALEQTGAPTFCLGGGVAANPVLRQAYEQLCADLGVKLVMPPLHSCGDNAGMIALVGLDRYRMGRFAYLNADAHASADLEQPY